MLCICSECFTDLQTLSSNRKCEPKCRKEQLTQSTPDASVHPKPAYICQCSLLVCTYHISTDLLDYMQTTYSTEVITRRNKKIVDSRLHTQCATHDEQCCSRGGMWGMSFLQIFLGGNAIPQTISGQKEMVIP